MALISAWRRKPSVHLIAIIDCILAVFTLVLHTYNFIDEDSRKLELLAGFIDTENHWGLYVLVWVIIYVFSILQFLVAHLLHMSVRPDYADAQLVQTRASRWLRFSSLIFLTLVIKLLLCIIYLAKYSHVDVITLLACLTDIIFRVLTAWIVKRFVDDLRSQYPPVQRPSVYFINLFGRPAPTNNNQA